MAAAAGKDAGAGAFGTTEGEVEILGVGGGKVVELTEDFGFVMFDKASASVWARWIGARGW